MTNGEEIKNKAKKIYNWLNSIDMKIYLIYSDVNGSVG